MQMSAGIFAWVTRPREWVLKRQQKQDPGQGPSVRGLGGGRSGWCGGGQRVSWEPHGRRTP